MELNEMRVVLAFFCATHELKKNTKQMKNTKQSTRALTMREHVPACINTICCFPYGSGMSVLVCNGLWIGRKDLRRRAPGGEPWRYLHVKAALLNQ